ncbi:MAG: hypothetical protein WBA62_22025 [Xanthobacteraceae bacterium]
MTWQTQFGKRESAFGNWIAKPGYDVTTTSSGNMLFDTSKLGMQPLQSGSIRLYLHGEGGTGTISKTVSLVSALSGASRIAVAFDPSYLFTTSIPSPYTQERVYDDMTFLDDLQAVVSGGTLYLNYVNPPRLFCDTFSIDVWAFYTVLRARY